MAKVKFTFEDKNIADKQIDNAPAGDSLLEIALDNGIELHHNCGAVCACSTCHVYVKSGEDLVEEISDKEEDFIDRARSPRLESRLACQCVILEDTDKEIIVEVPDQSQIQGE